VALRVRHSRHGERHYLPVAFALFAGGDLLFNHFAPAFPCEYAAALGARARRDLQQFGKRAEPRRNNLPEWLAQFVRVTLQHARSRRETRASFAQEVALLALALNQRQIRALCEGAKKAGYAPIVQIGNVLVRLVPEDRAIPPQDNERIDEERVIDL